MSTVDDRVRNVYQIWGRENFLEFSIRLLCCNQREFAHSSLLFRNFLFKCKDKEY